jgi:hypothetical protein
MTTTLSLDERYLEFEAATRPAFERHPQLEVLRQFVFKELVVGARPFGWRDSAKRWIRPILRRSRTVGPLRPCDVLMLVEGGREVILESLLPVARELTKRGDRVQVVSMNSPEALPIPAVTLRYRCPWLVQGWAKQAWNELCAMEHSLASPHEVRAFFSASMEAAGLLAEFDRVLAATGARVAVTASTQLMGGAALVVAARSRRVPSVVLQHGVLQPLYVPVVADRMCTWGRSSDETLIRHGVEGRRLVALGSPRHDAMKPGAPGEARRQVLRDLELSDRPLLVFFSNGNDLSRNGAAPAACARWLAYAAERYRDKVHIVVRLHPNEDGSLYRRCAALTVTKKHPSHAAVLDAGDCVASLCSTAMLEALLYRKPVWHFHADGWPVLATNWQEGLAERISSGEQLCAAIEGTLLRQVFSPIAAEPDRVFANHGSATQAVAEFLITETRRLAQPPELVACEYAP